MKPTVSRELGRSGIVVSGMGLGCWAIGGLAWRGDTPTGWGQVNDGESIQAIHRALDLGITFFDTADSYGAGHSERILGKALTGHRSQVIIATKFGNIFDEESRQSMGTSASPAYIRQACEASLRRLGSDTIDLYQFHHGGFDPIEAVEVRETLEQLITEGKIRSYGWSTDDPNRARVFAEGPGCTAVQHQMNVLEEAGQMVALCQELNLASINRGPLAMGLLAGKYGADSKLAADDVRGEKSPEWMVYFKDGRPNSEWLAKLDSIRQILTSGGRTLAQGALAWLWAYSPKSIPIPGFRTVAQVEENCGAMGLGPLTAGQMQEIDSLLGR